MRIWGEVIIFYYHVIHINWWSHRCSIKFDEFFSGRCGDLKCTDGCQELLSNDYRFYLAFENSVCHDYVTEKFFGKLKADIVPIVLNKENYESVAPKNSFIAVNSFKSVKDLANYLKYLAKNITAYMEYFEWRSRLKVTTDDNSFCRLCTMLWSKHQLMKSVPDINNWWHTKGKCQADFGITIPLSW